jgi:hypothetical protein
MAGSLEFIKSASGTSVSSFTVNDCFSADYEVYKIVVDDINMNATAGIRGRIRFVDTSETVITSSNYDYAVQQLHSFQAFGENKATNTSVIDYFTIDIENTAEGNGGIIYIYNPYSSSTYTFLNFQTSFYNEGSGGQGQKGIGVLKTTDSIGGINFTAHSGNIDSISLSVYGVK